MASCLNHFATKHLSGKRHITFYSDGCPGQNKNNVVVTALCHMAHNRPDGQVVEVKFFESGHTHMDVDSVHANIERACTGTEIGTPGEYVQVFKSAKKDDHLPYICEEVECSFFVDWKQVSRTALRPGCTDGISHMHWIRAEKVNGSVVLSWSESAMGPLQQVDWRRVGGQFG